MTNSPSHGSPRRLTSEALALEAGVTPQQIDQLLESGAIQRDTDAMHEVEDIPRVRLAQALADGGIDMDDLLSILRRGELQLDWVARLWRVAAPTGRTFADFAASLGDRASLLPPIYAAFGLAVPPPETITRQDEEEAIADFIDLWSMVGDRMEIYLRAARIAGEGVRRIQAATQDLFDEFEGPPGYRLRRGLSPEDAIRPAMRLGPVISQLLVWLQTRHHENEVFGRIVTFVEDTLVQAGRPGHNEEPPAIAFVDLSGYTQLTIEAGDERAAQYATSLQPLAEAAARTHRGHVVKLLGDGVMLRYASAHAAVSSVGELMKAIVEAGLPPAHAGIAAGPIVVRDGDVYGHTVNIAARIAAHAATGELLVTSQVAERLAAAGIHPEDAGEASLKGLAEPVRLSRMPLA